MTTERIAKRMAGAGLCSRREAERWIEQGRVKVNGKTIDTPATLVSEADEIWVDGKTLEAKPTARIWLYHKPSGLVTTHKDPEGRPTVFDAVKEKLPRVISVGRLDLTTEGLLLLTNDGALARHFELPQNKWKRCYRVRIHGTPTAQQIAQLKKGITVDGVHYGGIGVEIEKKATTGRNIWVLVTLEEGKNREIRKVFEHLGYTVNRLIRVSYGPFTLANLPRGAISEVPFHVVKKHAAQKGNA